MTRRGLLVVASVLGHALVLTAIVVVSMLATGAIPTPFDRVTFAMERPVRIMDVHLPSVRPAARHAANTPASASPQIAPPEVAAPVVAPSTIGTSPADNDSLATGGTREPMAFDGGGSLPGFGIAERTPPATLAAAPTPAPIRAASTGVRAPQKVSSVDPVYPAAARAARIEGIVIIEATIDAEGRVQSTTVLKSIPLLDRAAVDAVRQWRFTPTLLNGSPVSVILTVTVNFSLAAR
jgi:periplasmic protein TonB